MKRRVIGVFLVLLLLGGALGYGWAVAGTEEPHAASGAGPVPAESPSYPSEVERPYAEDVVMATLPKDLAYVRETIGVPPFVYAYKRPRGWLATDLGAGERSFSPPDRMEGGYGMRVKIVNARMTTQEMVEQKLAGLESTEDDVEVISRSSDSLGVTYRSSENRLRYNTFRWFEENGFAVFEVSDYGRQQDYDPGLIDLMTQVSASIRRVED